MINDVRHAVRTLVTRPGSSLVIILALALAVGANSVIFSFVDAVLLRPLPVKDPKTIGMIFGVNRQRGNDRAGVSLPDFLDWRDHVTTLLDLAASTSANYTLTGRGDATRLSGSQVTASVFRAWGLAPVLGRPFAPDENQPGAPAVVLLKHGYWIREFGADPGVLGTTLVLDGTPHVVVGVLGPDLEVGNMSLDDIWTPLLLDPTAPRDRRTLSVTGRLKPGVSIDQASRELTALARRLAEEYPTTNAGWSARVVSFYRGMTGRNSWLVLALLGVMVGLVLLIACANVANLLLARATTRTRELAVRLSLGASRLRVSRQLLVEGLLLGVLGGGIGLLLTVIGLTAMAAVDAEPIFQQLVIDRNVLIFVTCLSLLAPMLFSLPPVAYGTRMDLRTALNDGGRGTTVGRAARRSRAALVVFQVALALALLIVSSLTLRSALAVEHVELGFRPADVLMGRVGLDETRYDTADRQWQFIRQVLARVEGTPGVSHAAAVNRVPVLDGGRPSQLAIEGRPEPLPDDVPWAVTYTASPDLLNALSIPLVRGRFLRVEDRRETPLVAVVNEEMARRYWPDSASPIGQRVRFEGTTDAPQWMEIVGVVGDVASGSRDPLIVPQLYVPVRQHATESLTLLVRANGPGPAVLTTSLRAAVRELDPDLALYDLEPLQDALDRAHASARIMTGLFLAFGLMALFLATTGLFGVMSYAVNERIPEIGTRMALGAPASAIRTMVLRQAAWLVMIGGTIGLLGGLGLGLVLRRALYGIAPTDPVTLVGAATLLALLAIAASYPPARRATRVDPIVALRAP